MPKVATASIADVAKSAFRKGEARPSAQADEGLTPVTVRLTPDRFRRLKLFGLDTGRKSQGILVEALDAYLDAQEGKP